MAHTAWTITLNGKTIDTVFFDKDCDKEYVKSSLINHDGYDPGIKVRRERRDRVKVAGVVVRLGG